MLNAERHKIEVDGNLFLRLNFSTTKGNQVPHFLPFPLSHSLDYGRGNKHNNKQVHIEHKSFVISPKR